MSLDIMTTKLFVETKQNQGSNGQGDIYVQWIDQFVVIQWQFTASNSLPVSRDDKY